MKKRRKLKTWVIILFMVLCLIGLVYSCYKIYNWNNDTNENKQIKDKIDDSILVDTKEEIPKYKIDWDTIKEQNSDTIAYLKVNNTNIDYVVVKGKDNSYYLSHNFNKEYNIAGWVFADYHNNFDGMDKNIIIYGHNTRDNSMFGSLKNILEESWYNNEENYTIDLVTENGLSEYQVFSVYTITREDYYINTNFSTDDKYMDFLNTLKERSIKDFDIVLNSKDKILTLSTCATGGVKRVVLHARLIDNE